MRRSLSSNDGDVEMNKRDGRYSPEDATQSLPHLRPGRLAPDCMVLPVSGHHCTCPDTELLRILLRLTMSLARHLLARCGLDESCAIDVSHMCTLVSSSRAMLTHIGILIMAGGKTSERSVQDQRSLSCAFHGWRLPRKASRYTKRSILTSWWLAHWVNIWLKLQRRRPSVARPQLFAAVPRDAFIHVIVV